MDMDDVRGIGTLLVMIAFLAVCVWAYSSKQKDRFDEAANLPFADEDSDEEDKKPGDSKVEKD